MITYVKRKDLDVVQYDKCVEQSSQSTIFAFSWYLDVTCDNWDALILNDYDAVMPIPWRRKYFITYVYQPLWILELGIYSKIKIKEDDFLNILFQKFKFVELRLNFENKISNFKQFKRERMMQVISLKNDYDSILRKYNRNRKRELKKAKEHQLTEDWKGKIDHLINLFKNNVGNRVSEISDKDYNNLKTLINKCIQKDKGYLLSVFDHKKKLVSAAFFVSNRNVITEVVCSSDFENRDNGANTFMNDRALFKFQPEFDLFNFGGSSMEGIAKYYRSFGGVDLMYTQIYYNNLPKVLKLFKK